MGTTPAREPAEGPPSLAAVRKMKVDARAALAASTGDADLLMALVQDKSHTVRRALAARADTAPREVRGVLARTDPRAFVELGPTLTATEANVVARLWPWPALTRPDVSRRLGPETLSRLADGAHPWAAGAAAVHPSHPEVAVAVDAAERARAGLASGRGLGGLGEGVVYALLTMVQPPERAAALAAAATDLAHAAESLPDSVSRGMLPSDVYHSEADLDRVVYGVDMPSRKRDAAIPLAERLLCVAALDPDTVDDFEVFPLRGGAERLDADLLAVLASGAFTALRGQDAVTAGAAALLSTRHATSRPVGHVAAAEKAVRNAGQDELVLESKVGSVRLTVTADEAVCWTRGDRARPPRFGPPRPHPGNLTVSREIMVPGSDPDDDTSLEVTPDSPDLLHVRRALEEVTTRCRLPLDGIYRIGVSRFGEHRVARHGGKIARLD